MAYQNTSQLLYRAVFCTTDILGVEYCAVIPFECGDISTCLDGYAHPPSYQDCVALGPVTTDSIRLDYNTSGPGSKKVAVSIATPSAKISHYISINEVFLWVRKARQYLNICRAFMVDTSMTRSDG